MTMLFSATVAVALCIRFNHATAFFASTGNGASWATAQATCQAIDSSAIPMSESASIADLVACTNSLSNGAHRAWLSAMDGSYAYYIKKGDATSGSISSGSITSTNNKFRGMCCESTGVAVTPSPVTPAPTPSPVTKSPTSDPVTKLPTASPVTESPTTAGPTGSPVTPPPTSATPAPITAAPTTEASSCGTTLTGTYVAGNPVLLLDVDFNANYGSVLFSGCQSNYDLKLYVYDDGGVLLNTEDTWRSDLTDAATCGHGYANDLLLETGGAACSGVSAGSYKLGISGYGNAGGNYAINVNCLPSDTVDYMIPATASPAPRVRQSFMEQTVQEQEVYCSAFQLLYTSGVWQQLSAAHYSYGVHNDASFLPWHRHFVYVVEEVIRSLGIVDGTDYTSFSMPYWNWAADLLPHEGTPAIFGTCLGDASGSDVCVSGDFFEQYQPMSDTCLRRNQYTATDGDTWCEFSQEAELMSLTAVPSYLEFYDLLEGIPHASPHVCLDNNMNTYYSPDDPLFYLHHTFVDFEWALWQDCNNFDTANDDSAGHYSGSYTTCLDYGNIAPSVMASETLNLAGAYNAKYVGGDYFEDAGVLDDTTCMNDINSDWFISEPTRRRLPGAANKRPRGVAQRKRASKDLLDEIRESVADDPANALLTKQERRRLVLSTWREQDCFVREETTGMTCESPQEGYYDCSDMARDRLTGDITMSKDEMLSKFGNTDCMLMTIETVYEWALMRGELKFLCAGCFDRVCDDSYRDGKCSDSANPNHAFKGVMRQNGGGFTAKGVVSVEDSGNDVIKKILIDESHSVGLWLNKVGHGQITLLQAGVLLGCVLLAANVLVLCCCWACCGKKKNGKYGKVMDSDDEEDGSGYL